MNLNTTISLALVDKAKNPKLFPILRPCPNCQTRDPWGQAFIISKSPIVVACCNFFKHQNALNASMCHVAKQVWVSMVTQVQG